MKSKLSIASLAVSLTTPVTVLIFLITGILQWLLFDPAFFSASDYFSAFEFGIDGRFWQIGRLGFYLLILALMFSLISRKTDFHMTLDRLGVSHRECTVLFGLILSVWFLLYWFFQTALAVVIYSRYASHASVPATELLLACYTSKYLHLLIPLRNVWGYARNILIAFSFGMTVSCTAYYIRQKKQLGLGFIPIVWVAFVKLLTPNHPVTRTEDLMLSVLCLMILSSCLYFSGRRTLLEKD